MARKEAELLKYNEPRFMNLELAKFFKNRTAEAIKKARQKPEYRAIVEQYLAPINSPPNSPVNPSTPFTTDSPNSSIVREDPSGHFLDYILNIPAGIRTPSFNAIVNIAVNAEKRGRETTSLDIANFIMTYLPIKYLTNPCIRGKEGVPNMHEPRKTLENTKEGVSKRSCNAQTVGRSQKKQTWSLSGVKFSLPVLKPLQA